MNCTAIKTTLTLGEVPQHPAEKVENTAPGLEFAAGDPVVFSWFWPIPLGADEVFTVHLLTGDSAFLLGTVDKPATGARYRLQKRGDEIAEQPGEFPIPA